jgi:hypothetical protein
VAKLVSASSWLTVRMVDRQMTGHSQRRWYSICGPLLLPRLVEFGPFGISISSINRAWSVWSL